MIAFMLICYVFVMWLIFFQFKLLKFDLKAKITSAVVGLLLVVGLTILVNFVHPQTLDARVYEHVVEIASRLPQPGRVVEVPVKANTPVKKGDVLFRIDSRPYEYEVTRLTAALAEAEQTVPQLAAALAGARVEVDRLTAETALAQTTLDRELDIQKQNPGAVSAQKIDELRQHLTESQNAVRAASANVEQARIAVEISGPKIDQIKAQLASAQLNLEESTILAPADGFVTNLELEPGYVVAPGQAVVTFVYNPQGVIAATFPQEYLKVIEAGNPVEIALDLYPGEMLRGKVESVIWASGQGQLTPTGTLPTITQAESSSRFAVKIKVDPEDVNRYRLPAGASGSVAVYTNHLSSLQVLRKIIIRWYTWLNYVKLSL